MTRVEGSSGKIVRFPFKERMIPVVAIFEEVMRTRWDHALAEPIPAHLLILLSQMERIEQEIDVRLRVSRSDDKGKPLP